jgi:hypothetical protein
MFTTLHLGPLLTTAVTGTVFSWYCIMFLYLGTVLTWYCIIMVLYYHATVLSWYCIIMVLYHCNVFTWYGIMIPV